MGVGTLGSLAGGVRNAFEAPERKRRFLEDEKRKAQVLALRNSKWGRFKGFFPTNAYDAKYKADAVAREAEDNPAYNADPMSLIPFVGNATQLAGGIYDAANATPAPKPRPESLQMYDNWRPGQAPANMTPANPTPYEKKWWEL